MKILSDILSFDIICSSNLTVSLKLRFLRTVHFWEEKMYNYNVYQFVERLKAT